MDELTALMREVAAEEARRGLPPVREAVRASAPVTTASIMAARTKPKGVSDVRWRIELSRRRAQRRSRFTWANPGDDPDALA